MRLAYLSIVRRERFPRRAFAQRHAHARTCNASRSAARMAFVMTQNRGDAGNVRGAGNECCPDPGVLENGGEVAAIEPVENLRHGCRSDSGSVSAWATQITGMWQLRIRRNAVTP